MTGAVEIVVFSTPAINQAKPKIADLTYQHKWKWKWSSYVDHNTLIKYFNVLSYKEETRGAVGGPAGDIPYCTTP